VTDIEDDRPSSEAGPEGGGVLVRIDEESPFFDGHFPGDPILPGVGLLGLVLEAVEGFEQRPITLAGLRDFRLRHVVRPGDAIEVQLARTSRPGEVRFAVRSGSVLSSSGVLILAPPPPPSP
jgi:3-hydroxyacyl-[acyl-carrier-protein] dehydratase